MADKVVTATPTVNRLGRLSRPPCYTAEMLKKLVATVVIFASAALSTACGRTPSDDPDLLLTGGMIYPLGSTDEAVEAVAIRGNDVLAMGTDAEILQLAGPYTQQMPLEDSVVLPGVYDAWVDLEALGRWSTASLDLRRASSLDEVRAMVRNAADAPTTVEGWIVGWGWDENDWPEAELPDQTDLDAAGPTGPVALLHRSGLMAWVNSAALTTLTDLPTTDDSSRRAAPVPSGILMGSARDALAEVLAGDADQRAGWLAEGARQAAAAGITRAATPPLGESAIEHLLELEFRGLLPLRVDIRLQPDVAAGFADSRLRQRLNDSELLRVVAVGIRLDGPLASRLAALEAPYADGSSGLSLVDDDDLDEAAQLARAVSLPLHVHASGDRAITRALETIRTDSAPGALIVGFDLSPDREMSGEPRFDVAIAAARFARDIYAMDAVLGVERAQRAHAWADVASLGGSLAFASDAPAYSLRPLAAVAAAITRQDAEGYPADGWNIDQALPQSRLLRALFLDPMGAGAGLSVGRHADLVVWSEDPVLGDAGALRRAEALLTIVAGRVAYSRALVEPSMETQASR